MNFASANNASLPQTGVFKPVFTSCRALADTLAAVDIPTVAIGCDGRKAPAVETWAYLQQRVATKEERDAMFLWQRMRDGKVVASGPRHVGIAWVMRGDHELIDFDEGSLIDAWRHLVEDESPGLLDRLVEIETPDNGRHFSYRHGGEPLGSHHLAEELRLNARGQLAPYTLIETRGPGGYAVLPGSPLECHESGRPYILRRGKLTELPHISADERDTLLSCARQLDRCQEAHARQQSQWGQRSQQQRGTRPHSGDDGWIVRPGDEYSAHVSWSEILTPAGWRPMGERGSTTRWCRPGKKRGTSATTSDFGEHGVFYCFSSNAYPFEAGQSYSPFAAYALLNHDGDFTAAAKRLHLEGYGKRAEKEQQPVARTTRIPTSIAPPRRAVQLSGAITPPTAMRLHQ